MLKKIGYARILLLLSTAGITYGIDTSLLPELFMLTNAVSPSESRKTSRAYKANVINLYCEKALTDQGALLFTGDTFYFSSKNSLFLRALCVSRNSEKRGDKDNELIKSVFKENFAKKLNLQQFKSNKDLCASGSGNSQNECDFSRYSSKVYQTLMSDLFKIKRAEVLQVPSNEVFKSKEDRIAKIFETYFNMSKSDRSEYQKRYPKTSTLIDNNQKILYKSLQSLVILDNEGLRKMSLANTDCSPRGEKVSNIACGLHLSGDQTKGLNDYFKNLVVNEYLNYRLFTDFYINWLKSIQPTVAEETAHLIELNAIIQQREMFETALMTSLKELEEVATTYPLHIGLVLYQEELLKFRDNYIAKLVTPLYTLYEKLRNVQPPY